MTVGDAYELLPFGNTIVVVDLSGGEIDGRQVMDNASDVLRWIRPEATYSIATFSYLAEGKDGFDGLLAAQSRWDSGFLDVDAFIEFARANDICD